MQQKGRFAEQSQGVVISLCQILSWFVMYNPVRCKNWVAAIWQERCRDQG